MSDEDDDGNLISKEHPGRHAREDHDKEWKKLWIVELPFFVLSFSAVDCQVRLFCVYFSCQ